MHAILGLLVLLAALGGLARLARDHRSDHGAARLQGRPASEATRATGESGYRAGPWPGLTARGAAVLVVCSAMLVGCELVVGVPGRAWPDLVVVSVLDALPVLLATCLVRAPGCAAAVCGVYLLGRTLATLVQPGLELPPLLLPAAVGCDLAIWMVREDLSRPRRGAWRRRMRPLRRVTTARAAMGGLTFAVVLALVEPSFRLWLGAEPANWSAPDRLVAGIVAGVGCAAAGAGLERTTSRPRAAQ